VSPLGNCKIAPTNKAAIGDGVAESASRDAISGQSKENLTAGYPCAVFLGSAVSTILVSPHLVHSNVCTSEPAPFGINLIRVMSSAHLVQRG